MKKFLPLLFLIALVTGPFKGFAQVLVKGIVTDATKGDKLPGVSVVVKGTTVGATSNADGTYLIEVPSANSTLVFSFIGLVTQEVAVGNRTTINVSLLEDVKTLNDVVVIGYGTAKRSDVTGSVATVKTEDLLKTIPTSINQGLQGQVAGVTVNRSDGAPGAGISLTIRGANTVLGGSEPLYVIDGIPFTAPASTASSASGANPSGGNGQSTNALSFLNPQDIESMDILKDASATAIYGSRGANGVVMITTKKGRNDRDRIDVVANTSISQISRRIKVLNAYQYAQFQNEAQLNAEKYNGNAPTTLPFPGERGFDQALGDTVLLPGPDDFLNGTRGTSYPDGFTGTDWQDQIFRTAVTKDYTVRMSGGNDKGTYSVSGNMLDQQGIIYNSGFKRYGLQMNIARKVHKWLELGTNNNLTFTSYNLSKTNSNGNEASIISSALFFPPTYPVSSATSKAREDITSWYAAANPYNYTRTAKDKTNSTGIYSSTYALLTFNEHLNFRQNLGVNYNTNTREVYYNRRLQEARTTNGYAFTQDDTWRGITLESILSFNRTFGQDHTLNAVAALTRETGYSYYRNMSVRGFTDDLLENNNMGAGIDQKNLRSGKAENALLSMLGRINYSYKGRYLATASFRRDGSSKFTSNNKFANFSSFALAWNAAEESFMQNLGTFSTLKFRVGYGQTGNQAIRSYGTLAHFSPFAYPVNGTLQPGYADEVYLGVRNPNLIWETTAQFDAGLDMGVLQNRFNFTVDVYSKKTSDLLQQIQTPNSTGFPTQLVNFGSIQNRGLELSANGALVNTTRFKWNLNANISFNRNKMLDLPADQFAGSLYNNFDNFFLQRNGQPLGTVYGFVEDGFYDNLAEVMADPYYASQSEAVQQMMVGEIKYKNFDDDPAITAKDRQIIGNTTPDYDFGVTNNFSYGNLSVSVFFQGVQGNDLVNTNLYQIRMGKVANVPQFVYDGRWTPATAATATWPKALAADTRTVRLSDRLVQDGSYVRLKNINVGYAFKQPVRYIESVNVYASVSNVWTSTKYKWYDPDVNAFGSNPQFRGVDMNSYPNSRTFTLGVSAGF
ncbi:TonB-dependent receptor [Hymenobacter sp. BT18]|uniref:SusC/RagA family TonB-linked outer membrane protein n=1 Tax=Hymenobacter sp. BT18 TaxID=2835648 RepID=UPI00143EB474|nr:TonB-dependent receptor [Hymenobacter sp. BT18]QIX60134.1 TonB-dependent receptor [Hymenobacter sp. BT18]